MIRRSFPLLLLLLTVGGCGDADDGPSGDVGAPNPPALAPDRPERIVSLVPSATEILRAIGSESRLVGRTDFDVDPELAHLPSVGGGLNPSVEQLVALDPDLVIRFEGESDRATGEQLDRAGIRHFGIRPDGIEDVRGIIRRLGAVVGREAEADSLVTAMDGELDALRSVVAGAAPVRAVFLLGGDPPWAAGEGTYLHELLELAGGENAFADLGQLYGPISLEEIVRRDVDVIVALEGSRLPAALRAIRVVRVPAEVQVPGHRLGSAAWAVARALHPALVP